MNKTRKLTQGAMLLAIIGALMLIDRQLSFLFEDLIVLAVPVVIVIYSTMYSVKDGALLCFGLGILTVLFGSTLTYIYMPVSCVVGLGMSIGVKKNLDRRKLSIIAIILYVIGEVIATFVVMPIIGIDLASQVGQLSALLDQYGLTSQMSALNINVPSFLIVMYIASTIIVGILEGYLTSLLTTMLLKRLKIKDIGISSIMDLKISPVTTYILFALSILMFTNIMALKDKNEILVYVVMCISFMAMLVLVYYGYIFCLIFGKMMFGKKALIFILLFLLFLFPTSFFVLMIIGFLYGAGPLRNFLERKLGMNNEEKQ